MATCATPNIGKQLLFGFTWNACPQLGGRDGEVGNRFTTHRSSLGALLTLWNLAVSRRKALADVEKYQ